MTRYSAIQTVNEKGEAVDRERLVYINGQHLPTPAAHAALSRGALAAIRQVGPYTQDFSRVLLQLQPERLAIDTLPPAAQFCRQ